MAFPGQMRGLLASEKVPEVSNAVRSPGRTWLVAFNSSVSGWLPLILGRTRRVQTRFIDALFYGILHTMQWAPDSASTRTCTHTVLKSRPKRFEITCVTLRHALEPLLNLLNLMLEVHLHAPLLLA